MSCVCVRCVCGVCVCVFVSLNFSVFRHVLSVILSTCFGHVHGSLAVLIAADILCPSFWSTPTTYSPCHAHMATPNALPQLLLLLSVVGSQLSFVVCFCYCFCFWAPTSFGLGYKCCCFWL